MHTDIIYQPEQKTVICFMYWDTSLFDKMILLFKINNWQKTVTSSYPFIIHRGTPGYAQVGFQCLHYSTQMRSLLVPAPDNQDRALRLHMGQGKLLPRITWRQGIQTLCLGALAFRSGLGWSCQREGPQAGNSKCSLALDWN